MNYVKLFIDIIGIIFELFISFMFFNYIWGKPLRAKLVSVSVGFIILMCLGVCIPVIKPYMPILAYVAFIILAIVYDSRLISKIIYITILFLSFLTSEMFVALTISTFINKSVEKIVESIYGYTCGVIFSKFIVYIIIKVIISIKNKQVSSSLISRIPHIIIPPIVTAYTVLVIFSLSYTITNIYITLLTVLAVVLLMLADVFIIIFIDRVIISETKAQRLKFTENQLKVQSAHYTEIMEKQKEISKMKHDMNNYLISLSGYISNNNTEMALKTINKYVGIISENGYIKSHNYCLEALLNAKYKIIKEKNIPFNFKINLPELLNIDEIDLCIIIGNILDNAIEASDNVDIKEQKGIDFNIVLKGEYISIFQSNLVSDTSIPKKGFKTIKKETDSHGFGIDNIKAIAKKYEGSADFKYKDKTFFSCIMLKN